MDQNKKLKLGNLRDYTVYAAFVIFFLIFSVSLKDVGNGFASLSNLMNVLRQTCLLAILSVGMCCVIGCGQIDLSLGSVVGLTSVIVSMSITRVGPVLAILFALCSGALIGLINGVLIAYVKLAPFIATMGTSLIWQGLSRKISALKTISIMDETFVKIFGGGTIGIIPITVVWMIVICAAGWVVMYKTPLGRKIIAVGGNERSAKYSGINVEHIRTLVMIICSVLAALVGILWSGRFGGGRYSLGENSGTDVIAATVLGGAAMRGGKVSIAGAMVGSVFIGMLNNALVLYGLDTHEQMIVSGITIILAVAVTIKREPLK